MNPMDDKREENIWCIWRATENNGDDPILRTTYFLKMIYETSEKYYATKLGI